MVPRVLLEECEVVEGDRLVISSSLALLALRAPTVSACSGGTSKVGNMVAVVVVMMAALTVEGLGRVLPLRALHGHGYSTQSADESPTTTLIPVASPRCGDDFWLEHWATKATTATVFEMSWAGCGWTPLPASSEVQPGRPGR